MNHLREDAYCPACPDPETAFRIEDAGMKVDYGDFSSGADGLRMTASRPVWEPVMLDHLRSRLDDPEHRRVYDLCVTELMAVEKTAEDVARYEVQAVADMVRRQLEQAVRRLPEIPSLAPRGASSPADPEAVP